MMSKENSGLSDSKPADSRFVNAKPESPYPLVGNAHFTAEERAAFLQRARDQEREYERYVGQLRKQSRALENSVKDYPHEQLPDVNAEEHKFRNEGHPLYIKQAIENNKLHIEKLQEKVKAFNEKYPLELYPLNPDPSLPPLFDASVPGKSSNAYLNINQIRHDMEVEKLVAEEVLKKNQAKLEAFYEANPHKRPTVKVADANPLGQPSEAKLFGLEENQITHPLKEAEPASQILDSRVGDKNSGYRTPWYKNPQYFSYENPITHKHISRMPDIPHNQSNEPRPLKPYVAEPDMRAMYTNGSGDGSVMDTPWHKNPQNFPYHQPVSEEMIKRASKLALAGMGIMLVAETAKATPGELSEKLNAAGNVLKDVALDAVPGVTYVEKIKAGKYQDAALDAASYLPFGDMTMMARSPEAQAVIDALPKQREQLRIMMNSAAEAPINRHLAEYQMLLMDAKANGDVFKGLTLSSNLTDLAEKKVAMQAQWTKSTEIFTEALRNPDTNWDVLVKSHPEISTHAAIHLAAKQSGRPEAFITQIDTHLTASLARGTVPVLPAATTEANHHMREELSLTR